MKIELTDLLLDGHAVHEIVDETVHFGFLAARCKKHCSQQEQWSEIFHKHTILTATNLALFHIKTIISKNYDSINQNRITAHTYFTGTARVFLTSPMTKMLWREPMQSRSPRVPMTKFW